MSWQRVLSLMLLLAVGVSVFPLTGRGADPVPPFYLRTETGGIINPITGENADQPYSPRQTCGECHDYEAITKGFHFQQGWNVIRDDYSKDKPWVLSDGMMGRW
ncbi:hypothetical protein [Desulfothermobacter acidiphilus]|uniref:hypothetical protein n=1 Tax=Desulfothermobacter acidiphilus TaxID=1938353 RepID=UPI003F889A6B